MLLRRFYIQENEKGNARHMKLIAAFANLSAPKPRPKKDRELNTQFEDDILEAEEH